MRTQACPRCHAYPGVGAFCANCRVFNARPQAGIQAASRGMRLLEVLLELLLLALTGIIIWLIWFYFTARDAQTPAKKLLGLYVISEDGEPATPRRMFAREVLVKGVFFAALSVLLSYIPALINGLWILWDKDRQTLHDKIAETLVVAPVRGPAPLAREAPREERPAPPAMPPRAAPRPAPPAPPRSLEAYRGDTSRAERRQRELDEVEDLFRKGLITQRDYEERRRQALGEDR